MSATKTTKTMSSIKKKGKWVLKETLENIPEDRPTPQPAQLAVRTAPPDQTPSSRRENMLDFTVEQLDKSLRETETNDGCDLCLSNTPHKCLFDRG